MKKGNVAALLPIGVFLCIYLGLGIAFEYVMKIPMGFYNVPIIIAFLAAILVACLQNRKISFDGKLEITARDGLEAARTLTEFENAAASRVSVSEAFSQVEKIMAAVKAVCSPEQISQIVSKSEGKPLAVLVEREGEVRSVMITPRSREEKKRGEHKNAEESMDLLW